LTLLALSQKVSGADEAAREAAKLELARERGVEQGRKDAEEQAKEEAREEAMEIIEAAAAKSKGEIDRRVSAVEEDRAKVAAEYGRVRLEGKILDEERAREARESREKKEKISREREELVERRIKAEEALKAAEASVIILENRIVGLEIEAGGRLEREVLDGVREEEFERSVAHLDRTRGEVEGWEEALTQRSSAVAEREERATIREETVEGREASLAEKTQMVRVLNGQVVAGKATLESLLGKVKELKLARDGLEESLYKEEEEWNKRTEERKEALSETLRKEEGIIIREEKLQRGVRDVEKVVSGVLPLVAFSLRRSLHLGMGMGVGMGVGIGRSHLRLSALFSGYSRWRTFVARGDIARGRSLVREGGEQ